MMLAMSEESIASAEQALERARPNEGSVEQAVQRLIEEFLPIAEFYAYVHQQMHTDAAMDARAQPLRESLITLYQQCQGSCSHRLNLHDRKRTSVKAST